MYKSETPVNEMHIKKRTTSATRDGSQIYILYSATYFVYRYQKVVHYVLLSSVPLCSSCANTIGIDDLM